jgi:CubicO group peptidase (beta-lactamase class C family)
MPTRLAAIAAIVLCASLAAGGRAAQDSQRRAEALVRTLLSTTGTPAVSAAVAKDGRLVFSFGAGFADLEHDVRATGTTVYNIGSVSKPITGVAVMQRVERGRIRLDDDVRSYVPEFPDKGRTITIEHLLTHTSGIRHYRDTDFPGTPDNENIEPVDGFRDGLRLFANDPLLFAPGTRRLYTSYGVNLLEGVVEKAAGMPFETYLRDHVWHIAGMVSTRFDRPQTIVPHRARSYFREGTSWRNQYYNDLRYKFASGGMLASVEDLVRFGSALNAGDLLRPETRRRVFQPHAVGVPMFEDHAAPGRRPRQQGLLWDLREDDARRRVAFHCGSVKAFNACVVNFVDENLVAAVATNSWECCGWSQADQLAAVFRD